MGFRSDMVDLCVHNILGEACICLRLHTQHHHQAVLAQPEDPFPAYPLHPPPYADPDGCTSAADEESPSPYGTHVPPTPLPRSLSLSYQDQEDDDGVAITSESGSSPSLCSPGHACIHCGKGFRRNSDLTKHRRYHFKEHICPATTCGKLFATIKDLNRHLKTHEKGSGFRCPVHGCGKARSGHIYNRRDNFLRHMKKKHGTIVRTLGRPVPDCYGANFLARLTDSSPIEC